MTAKSAVLIIRLEESLKARFSQYCGDNGLTLSEGGRKAIESLLWHESRKRKNTKVN